MPDPIPRGPFDQGLFLAHYNKGKEAFEARRLEPARPRTYYRWRDGRGLTHVAEAPPPEGTVYQTARALD